MAKVNEVFGIFDVDGSEQIDKEEAVNHWKSAFGRISAKEFFTQVDADSNGQIDKDEFVNFWKMVKAYGHSEDEIVMELDNIKNGESWVGFSNIPKKTPPSSSAQ